MHAREHDPAMHVTRRDADPAGRRGGAVRETAVPDQLGSIRYLVDDVDAAVAFYAGHLDFVLRADARPA